MQLKMQITTTTESKLVAIRPRAIVGWELKHGKKISDLANGIGVSDMSWLAWKQLQDELSTTMSYDDWLESLIDIEPQVEENPTVPAEEGA